MCAAAAGRRPGPPCDVGLLRLQASHLRHPDAVKDMIKRSNTEWIAVLSAEQLRMQNVGDFVCEWFFDFHTLPFDVSRVQVTLGRAFGMARLRGKRAVRDGEAEPDTNCSAKAGRSANCASCSANWRPPNRRC
jgi:DNA-binding NtrC family response regulator